MKNNGKYCSGRKGMNMKPLAILLALTLLVGTAIGGTIAWLTDVTGPKVNTFTVGDIDITLNETKTQFTMVPGHTIDKDPVVAVLDGSQDCWLFVEIDESSNLLDYIEYAIAADWETVQDKDTNGVTVIGRKVMANAEDKSFGIIGYKKADNTFVADKVLVKDTVTKDMMQVSGTDLPSLTFKAYAVQLYKTNGVEFGATEAWTIAKPAGT